jgi:hypothetical protein
MLSCDATTSEWLRRIRAEFVEMPGMRLTRAQIGRLWGLDRATCDRLIDALIGAGFLKRTAKDVYARADHGV